MVEAFDRGIPVNDGKIGTIMIRVAFDARPAGPVIANQGWMQAPFLVQPLSYVAMAVEALELGRSLGGIMAVGAVLGACQLTVNARQRARGYLGRPRHTPANHQRARQDSFPTEPVHRSIGPFSGVLATSVAPVFRSLNPDLQR